MFYTFFIDKSITKICVPKPNVLVVGSGFAYATSFFSCLNIYLQSSINNLSPIFLSSKMN